MSFLSFSTLFQVGWTTTKDYHTFVWVEPCIDVVGEQTVTRQAFFKGKKCFHFCFQVNVFGCVCSVHPSCVLNANSLGLNLFFLSCCVNDLHRHMIISRFHSQNPIFLFVFCPVKMAEAQTIHHWFFRFTIKYPHILWLIEVKVPHVLHTRKSICYITKI